MLGLDAGQRARLYGFFSRLFVREVDDDFAGVLAGDVASALLPAFAESPERALGAAQRASLDADFTHLTVVNLVPYESFYRRDDAMIDSGSSSPVATFYRSYGFEADLSAGRALAPDHLGIELELMAVLCEREAEAESQGRRAYAARIREVGRTFLREHLLAWAPIYLLAVKRNARTVLYAEGAEALLELLLADHEALCRALSGSPAAEGAP